MAPGRVREYVEEEARARRMPVWVWITGVTALAAALLVTFALQWYDHRYHVYPWESAPPALVTRCGEPYLRGNDVGNGPGVFLAPFPLRRTDTSYGSPFGPEFTVYDSTAPLQSITGADGTVCPLVFYVQMGDHSFTQYGLQP